MASVVGAILARNYRYEVQYYIIIQIKLHISYLLRYVFALLHTKIAYKCSSMTI